MVHQNINIGEVWWDLYEVSSDLPDVNGLVGHLRIWDVSGRLETQILLLYMAACSCEEEYALVGENCAFQKIRTVLQLPHSQLNQRNTIFHVSFRQLLSNLEAMRENVQFTN